MLHDAAQPTPGKINKTPGALAFPTLQCSRLDVCGWVRMGPHHQCPTSEADLLSRQDLNDVESPLVDARWDPSHREQGHQDLNDLQNPLVEARWDSDMSAGPPSCTSAIETGDDSIINMLGNRFIPAWKLIILWVVQDSLGTSWNSGLWVFAYLIS